MRPDRRDASALLADASSARSSCPDEQQAGADRAGGPRPAPRTSCCCSAKAQQLLCDLKGRSELARDRWQVMPRRATADGEAALTGSPSSAQLARTGVDASPPPAPPSPWCAIERRAQSDLKVELLAIAIRAFGQVRRAAPAPCVSWAMASAIAERADRLAARPCASSRPPARQARLACSDGRGARVGSRPSRETAPPAPVAMRAWSCWRRDFEQGAVGGVLDQRVLEAVGRLGRGAAAEHELGGDQLVEGGLQLRLGPVGDRGEQRVGELAAERGADLRDLLDRREAVEAGEQRVVRASRGSRAAAAGRTARSGRPRPRAGPTRAPSWSAPRRTAARRRSWPRSARRPRPAAPCPDHPLHQGRALAPAEPD